MSTTKRPSAHHEGIARTIAACRDVGELLDVAETCIRTARLVGLADAVEAAAYNGHAQHAMRRMQAVRAAEVTA
jgi:hypothetical protein